MNTNILINWGFSYDSHQGILSLTESKTEPTKRSGIKDFSLGAFLFRKIYTIESHNKSNYSCWQVRNCSDKCKKRRAKYCRYRKKEALAHLKMENIRIQRKK